MRIEKIPTSITFLVYNNVELTSQFKDDVIKYNIPLISMSIEDALTLKSSVMNIPNVGGVVNINLSNGNIL